MPSANGRWTPDDAASACELCAAQFGIFNRRHHCRKCGSCVCAACSPKKAVVFPDQPAQRVCSQCHESLALIANVLAHSAADGSSLLEPDEEAVPMEGALAGPEDARSALPGLQACDAEAAPQLSDPRSVSSAAAQAAEGAALLLPEAAVIAPQPAAAAEAAAAREGPAASTPGQAALPREEFSAAGAAARVSQPALPPEEPTAPRAPPPARTSQAALPVGIERAAPPPPLQQLQLLPPSPLPSLPPSPLPPSPEALHARASLEQLLLAVAPEPEDEEDRLHQLHHESPEAFAAREAVARALSALGPAHPDTGRALQHLCAALMAEGKPFAAERPLRALLHHRATALGCHYPSTLSALHACAAHAEALDKLGDAEALYKGLAAAQAHTLGDTHPLALAALSDRARVLVDMGRAGDAAPILRLVLRLHRRALGARHPLVRATATALAGVLYELQAWEEAEGVLEEELAMAREALQGAEGGGSTGSSGGGNSSSAPLALPLQQQRLTACTALALVLKAANKRVRAEALFREAAAVAQETLGATHTSTLSALANLAAFLRDTGNAQGALEIYAAVLPARLALHGALHAATATVQLGYARALVEAGGRGGAACALFREALSTRRAVLGELHPSSMAVAHDYAAALLGVGQLHACEALLLQTLEHRRAVLGEGHRDTLGTEAALRQCQAAMAGGGEGGSSASIFITSRGPSRAGERGI